MTACGGMVLSQSGSEEEAGTGGGILPSSSAGQRNVRVNCCSSVRTLVLVAVLVLVGRIETKVVAPSYHDAGVRPRSQCHERTRAAVSCEEIRSSALAGFCSIRVQLLPEQKNEPSAQASTRSVLPSFSVIVP